MKVTKVYLDDRGILVPGHLIERAFCKSVFYPFDVRCGFSCQYITDRGLLVEFNTRAYREFYKKTYPVGTKIAVLEMREEPYPVPKGMVGTVTLVDDIATIHCRFENGRCLGVIPGVDSFLIISKA
ncbi:MAG: DUF4314 domain-containing protein [Eubacteriales bacterium]|nr:DUF4314 domain-containing protein [Eubacteriales bacterium]